MVYEATLSIHLRDHIHRKRQAPPVYLAHVVGLLFQHSVFQFGELVVCIGYKAALRPPKGCRMFIVKSGTGYFVKFGWGKQVTPQLTSDPADATRMERIWATRIASRMKGLGFVAELLELGFVAES